MFRRSVIETAIFYVPNKLKKARKVHILIYMDI